VAPAGPFADSLLEVPPPAFPAAEVEAAAASLYGIDAKAAPLTSERDQNFRLVAADGTGYVAKITNAAEDPGVTDFQTRALLHVEGAGLPVPRLVRSRTGAVVERIAGLPLRLITLLPGVPLAGLARTSSLRRNLGAALGALDAALADFRHPAARHMLPWDLAQAASLRPLLVHVEDPRRALAEAALDRFETHVQPRLAGLRWQVVHDDMNPWNALVEPAAPERISGLIDFGDMVETALVNDLAIACAYQLTPGDDWLAGALEVAAGFQASCPLRPDEAALLPDLIATRMVATVAITGWRARRHPGNAAYILRNAPSAFAGLEALAALDRGEAAARFTALCGGD